MEKQKLIWSGSPSQIKYLHIHIFNFLIIFGLNYYAKEIIEFIGYYQVNYILILTLLIVLYSTILIIELICIKYSVYEHRIGFKRGIMNLKYDETELYRIKDYSISAPFFLRIFGLSNLKMDSSDKTHSIIKFDAIKNGRWLLREIEIRVEQDRRNKGVREID
jgi:uncharacterized membrane protein YdbT with pleckstrin-like domain